MILIGHGLSSSGLFALVNGYYERTYSRNLLVNKGLLHVVPGVGLMWFLLVAANMAIPPSLNLVAEVFAFIRVIGLIEEIAVVLVVYSLVTITYSLILYMGLHHGPTRPMVSFVRASPILYTVRAGHLIPLYTMFVFLF